MRCAYITGTCLRLQVSHLEVPEKVMKNEDAGRAGSHDYKSTLTADAGIREGPTL